MSVLDEAGTSSGFLKGTLDAGLDLLSQNFELTFIKYQRVILPLDGYVFWVRAALLAPSASYNTGPYNLIRQNAPKTIAQAANTIVVKGSLHIQTVNQQSEDRNISINRVVFTAESEVLDLNAVDANTMYVAAYDEERFSFSQQNKFYQEADLYHYEGDAVYPTMETQIVDSVESLDFRNVIVSNSLPVWLTLNQFFPVYPSYLIAQNIEPPFASVHIEPHLTKALQAAPYKDSMSNSWQLVQDHVNVTIYGLRNFNAQDYLDYVYQYMLDTDVMGLMSFPVIQDDKELQAELNTIAMKKEIHFEVSYNQVRIREVARQLIKKVFVKYLFERPQPPMVFGYNVALAYEGPFQANEQLPSIVFLETTTLARGVAACDITDDFIIDFYQGYPDLGGQVVLTVTGTAGSHNPQLTFPYGPVVFYINQVLVPVVRSVGPNLRDLSLTFGNIPVPC